MKSFILSTPDEIIAHVTSFLDQFDLLNLRLTCQNFLKNRYLFEKFDKLTKHFQTRCNIFLITDVFKVEKIDFMLECKDSLVMEEPNYLSNFNEYKPQLLAQGLKNGDIIQFKNNGRVSYYYLIYNGNDFESWTDISYTDSVFDISNLLRLNKIHPLYWSNCSRWNSQLPSFKSKVITFEKLNLSYSVIANPPFCEQLITTFSSNIGCHITFSIRMLHNNSDNELEIENKFNAAVKNPIYLWDDQNPFIIWVQDNSASAMGYFVAK